MPSRQDRETGAGRGSPSPEDISPQQKVGHVPSDIPHLDASYAVMPAYQKGGATSNYGASKPFNGVSHGYNPLADTNAGFMSTPHCLEANATNQPGAQNSRTPTYSYLEDGKVHDNRQSGSNNSAVLEQSLYHTPNTVNTNCQYAAYGPAEPGYPQTQQSGVEPLPPNIGQQPPVTPLPQNPGQQQAGRLQVQGSQQLATVLTFQSIDDINKRNGRPLFTWTAGDLTIPRTNTQKQYWVRALLDAIRSTDNATEKVTTAFQNRWGSNANHYDPEDIEDLAWRMVESTVLLHTSGWDRRNVPVRDKNMLERIRSTQHLGFDERMDGIIGLLRRSKTTCTKLLNGDKFWATIGMPNALTRKTAHNKVSNDKRAADKKAARLALDMQEELRQQAQPTALQPTQGADWDSNAGLAPPEQSFGNQWACEQLPANAKPPFLPEPLLNATADLSGHVYMPHPRPTISGPVQEDNSLLQEQDDITGNQYEEATANMESGSLRPFNAEYGGPLPSATLRPQGLYHMAPASYAHKRDHIEDKVVDGEDEYDNIDSNGFANLDGRPIGLTKVVGASPGRPTKRARSRRNL